MNRPRRGTSSIGAIALSLVLVALGAGCAAASQPTTSSKAVATASISSAECAANKAAGTVVFLSAFGYDASAGILDVYAATKLGYFTDLCLKVDFQVPPPAENIYPLVSADKAQITGQGSAADDLLGVSNNEHVVAIATYGDTSDYAILARPSIKKLSELAGQSLGYHSVLPVVLSEMLAAGGVASKVHLESDNSYDPVTSLQKTFDAIQAYQSNEPLTLTESHVAYSEFTPAEFGVKGTFNVQVVNATFLHDHPGATADFLRAELHAFDYCKANAAVCVGFAAKAEGKGYDTAHALAEWKLETSLATEHSLPGKGVGVESTAEWTPELQALVAGHLVKTAPSLSSAEDPSLAASLYKGTTLIWP